MVRSRSHRCVTGGRSCKCGCFSGKWRLGHSGSHCCRRGRETRQQPSVAWFLSSLCRRRHVTHRINLRDSAFRQKRIVERVFVQPKTKGGYAMNCKNAALHAAAWRNSLARRTHDRQDKQFTRFQHTTSERSIRGAVAGFVFSNLTDRKEVSSHE